MIMLNKKLRELLVENALFLTDKQIDLLISYIVLLTKWNKVYNLTSVRNPEEMLTKHLIDSLVNSPYLQKTTFIDVGTGAGLPGIPLAIANPDKQFTLSDSLGKRIRFLNQVKSELALTNVEPIQVRIEKLVNRQFDGVISRAFSSLQTMLNLTQHLTHYHGKFYALKGGYPNDEIAAVPDNFVVNNIIKFAIPSMHADRHLIIIKKINR